MLRYFKISNRPNCYLASHESQIYVLAFEEVDLPQLSQNQTIDSPGLPQAGAPSETKSLAHSDIKPSMLSEFKPPVTSEIKPSLVRESSIFKDKSSSEYSSEVKSSMVRDSRDKEVSKLSFRGISETFIILNIYSLGEKDEEGIKQIIKQISEQITAESIKLLAPKFLKYMNKHIKLAKDDHDFFSTGGLAKDWSYNLPNFIGDCEAFLYYIRQKFEKFMNPCSINHGSMVANRASASECNIIDDPDSPSQKKDRITISHPKYNKMDVFEAEIDTSLFLFNHQRMFNEIHLTEFFGKCLFLLKIGLNLDSRVPDSLDSVFPSDKLPESGTVEMFSYLQSRTKPIPLNAEEVKKALTEKLHDMSLIEKLPNKAEKQERSTEKTGTSDSAPRSLTGSSNLSSFPSESEITTGQRLLELKFLTRGPWIEEKLSAYLTETLCQASCEYLIEHLFVYSKKNKDLLTLKEIEDNFINFMSCMDKIIANQKYENTSIHRSVHSHAISSQMLMRGFKKLDDIVEKELKNRLGNPKLQIHRLYAIRIAANTKNKGSSNQNANGAHSYDITNFSDSLEDIEYEYKKQIKALAGDKTKVVEIVGVICGPTNNYFIKKNLENYDFTWYDKIKIFESGSRNVNVDHLEFKIPRHIFLHYAIDPNLITISVYNLKEDLTFEIVKASRAFGLWSIQRNALYKIVFEDENYNYLEGINKRKGSKKIENAFINEINRTKDHKNMKAADSKNKTFAPNSKDPWALQKKISDVSPLTFTQCVSEIFNNFEVSIKDLEQFMSFDQIVKQIKLLQPDATRKYILEFIAKQGAVPIPEGKDEIAHKGNYFLEWARQIREKEITKKKLKLLMKSSGIASREEIKKLVNFALQSSENLLVERVPFFVFPLQEQMLFIVSKLGHEGEMVGSIPILDRYEDELEQEGNPKDRIREMNKIIDRLTDIIESRGYEIILNENNEDNNDAKSEISGMIVHGDNEKKFDWSSSSLGPHKASIYLDNDEGAKGKNGQETEISTAVAKKVFHSVIHLFRISLVSQFGATYPEIMISLEWNTAVENKQSKVTIAIKEMELMKETLDLRAFIYDYQLDTLDPVLEPKAFDHVPFDVSQVLLNFQNYFAEQPKHTRMKIIGTRVSISRGSLFMQSSPQHLFDIIHENPGTYNLTLSENKQLANIFFVNLGLNHWGDGENRIKVMLVHFDDDLYDKMSKIPEEKLSLDKSNTSVMNEVRMAYFILGESSILTDEQIMHLRQELKNNIIDVISRANKHMVAKNYLKRIQQQPEAGITKNDLHILLSHSNYCLLKEKEPEFMKACASLPIFGKEFEQFLKNYYEHSFIQLKIITEKKFYNEKGGIITTILLQRPSPQLLLLIEVNEATEIQNIYMMKIFSELKELTPEDRELLKEFKKVVFQWIWRFLSEN